MIMEFNKPGLVTTVLVTVLCLSITSVSAETYRWKDKSGKVHYGATVPAEYADQPYDVLNSAGLVIEHVEDSSIPLEVKVVEEIKGKQPLISNEERQIQTDRLLVIQYQSEEDIQTALELELAQLGYDSKLIKQSQDSTETTIREQIKLTANQQRANLEVTADQKETIEKLYSRRANDVKKLLILDKRELRIRERYQVKLDRYRFLISGRKAIDEAQPDQG